MGRVKIQSKSAAQVTVLPTKPTTSVGRQGQVMEGGESSYSATNVGYEGYDQNGNKCVEATSNPDGTTTFKNTSDDKCVIVMSEKHTISLAPKSEITVNTEKKEPNPVLEKLGKARSWIMKNLPDWAKSSPSSPKGGGGVRGNCDPEGIAGGCKADNGSGVVKKTFPEFIKAMAENEKKGLAKKLRWSQVNPSSDSPRTIRGTYNLREK